MLNITIRPGNLFRYNRATFVNNKKIQNKMGLKPGQTNNRAGRPAGRQNKATADLRSFVTDLLAKNKKQLTTDFAELTPVQRVQAFVKLLSFCLPQLQSTTLTDDLERLSETELDSIIKQLQNGQTN